MKQIWGTIGAAVLASALTVAGMTAIGAASADPPPAPALTAKEKGVAKAGPQAKAGTEAAALAAPAYQPVSESHFVSITPCRIVDTRAGSGTGRTRLSAGTTRTYYIGGTAGFVPQGGKSGGCGIPVGATAIAATFIAVNPSGSGAFRAYANGAAAPTANVLNYAGKTITGFSNVPINATSAYALKVLNLDTKTDLVIDVVGYYVKPLAGMISSSGTVFAGSSRIIGAQRLGPGLYEVQFDRDVRYCTATASVYVSSMVASTNTWSTTGDTDKVIVRVWDTPTTLADQYFYISVDC